MGKKHRSRSKTFSGRSKAVNKDAITTILPEPEVKWMKTKNKTYAHMVELSKLTGVSVSKIMDFIEIAQEAMLDDKDSGTKNAQKSTSLTIAPQPTGWKVEGPKCITKCEFAGDPVIVFTREAWSKVEALMHHYGNLEWLAYLVGEKTSEFSWRVTDLRIPKQLVQAAHVEVTDNNPDYSGVIGVCHSHNTMAPFFSREDKEFINANHPLSIVFATKAGSSTIDYKIMARRSLPCGELYEAETESEIIIEPDNHVKAWLEQVTPNITEEKRPQTYTSVYYDWHDDDHDPWWMGYPPVKAASKAAVPIKK